MGAYPLTCHPFGVRGTGRWWHYQLLKGKRYIRYWEVAGRSTEHSRELSRPGNRSPGDAAKGLTRVCHRNVLPQAGRSSAEQSEQELGEEGLLHCLPDQTKLLSCSSGGKSRGELLVSCSAGAGVIRGCRKVRMGSLIPSQLRKGSSRFAKHSVPSCNSWGFPLGPVPTFVLFLPICFPASLSTSGNLALVYHPRW